MDARVPGFCGCMLKEQLQGKHWSTLTPLPRKPGLGGWRGLWLGVLSLLTEGHYYSDTWG